jgi:hypothetical protein
VSQHSSATGTPLKRDRETSGDIDNKPYKQNTADVRKTTEDKIRVQHISRLMGMVVSGESRKVSGITPATTPARSGGGHNKSGSGLQAALEDGSAEFAYSRKGAPMAI